MEGQSTQNLPESDGDQPTNLTWDEAKILGEGRYGVVVEGKLNEKDVAVKKINTTDLIDVQIMTVRERNSMSQLDHPNVLKLLHAINRGSIWYFALERCEATISQYFQGEYKGPVPTDEDALKQMTLGLDHIHGKHYAHRDLSPYNILVTKSGDLKLSDFGFCKPTSATGSFSLKSGAKGTPRYVAAELITMANEANVEDIEYWANKNGNYSSDVFALGCLFYYYLSKGEHAFIDGKDATLLQLNVVTGKHFIKNKLATDHFAYKAIEGMILPDPKKRWTLVQVKESLNLD